MMSERRVHLGPDPEAIRRRLEAQRRREAQRRQRRRCALSVAAAALAVVGALWWIFHPRSAEEVRNEALRALERRDVRTLMRLAKPEEIERLNLTPDKVERMLAETIWRDGSPRLSRAVLQTHPARDAQRWEVYWRGKDGAEDPREFPLIVYKRSPREPWRLALSHALQGGYIWRDGQEGGASYRRAARSLGVRGVFDPDWWDKPYFYLDGTDTASN